MKNNFLLLIVLLVALSCVDKESTQRNLIKIDSLKQQIVKQKNAIKKQKSIKEDLYKKNSLKLSKIEEVQKERDSFIELIKIANSIDAVTVNTVFKDFYNPINYQVTSNDNYWKRGVYYTSEKENELLYNVRTTIVDGQIHFYFMGVKYPLDDGVLKAYIYELDENKELHTIDTIDLSPGITPDEEYDPTAERHMQKYMLLQLANLVIKDDRLYYFKINKLDYREVVKRDYYEYVLGSKQRAKKLDKSVLSNTIVITTEERKIISPDKKKIVINYFGDGFVLYKIPNWKEASQFLYTKTLYDFDDDEEFLPVIDFDFKKHFGFSDEEYVVDRDTDKNVFFGGVCWHATKNIVYFDNSGIDMRCIWKMDIDNKEVIKIVPEHEAIHPYYFETADKEYITYVEENKIMLSESPNNDN